MKQHSTLKSPSQYHPPSSISNLIPCSPTLLHVLKVKRILCCISLLNHVSRKTFKEISIPCFSLNIWHDNFPITSRCVYISNRLSQKLHDDAFLFAHPILNICQKQNYSEVMRYDEEEQRIAFHAFPAYNTIQCNTTL